MNELPSSEFRKAYANLTKPTAVTVLGRVIGTWLPTGSEDELVAEVAHLKRELAQRLPAGMPAWSAASQNPSLDYDPAERRARQAVIDATLNKVARKKEKA